MNLDDLVKLVGMPIELIGFERGLTLRPIDRGWATHVNSKTGAVIVDSGEVVKQFAPVLLRCRTAAGNPAITFILRPDGGFVHQVPSFALIQRHLYHGTAIHYMAGSLLYHLEALHLRYEIIRDHFKDISLIPGAEFSGQSNFQGQPEPYYEFDALVAVSRRAYDACRYVLWNTFGGKKSSIPASFEKTIPLCSGLDTIIRADLQRSWNHWGSVLTSYRDCIMHYVPIDFGLSTVSLHQAFPGIWAAQARIPDNPEVRSKAKFTFKKQLDALTFGWHLANEILRVIRTVVNAVEESEAEQPSS